MTSFLLKHSFNSLKCFSSSSSLSGRRAIHLTSVVHKKTPKYDFDDLFVDDLFEADLFAPPVQKITQNEVIAEAQKLSSMSINSEGSKTGKRRLSARSIAVKRAALLNKHIYFLKPRLGSTPSVHPNIRPRTWLTMMQLAKDGDDMKKILELIPILHEGGGALPSVFAEEFVRRCEKLSCQHLALEVFGDYAKYNITLTPDAGRWLIHSVHVLHPLKDLIIAASLFSVYNLSLADDLVSASMIAAACFKHDTPQSRAVANFLLPKIKTMVEKEKKKLTTTPVSEVEMKRQLKWVDWSLKKINKFVKKSSGEPFVPLPAVLPVRASVTQP